MKNKIIEIQIEKLDQEYIVRAQREQGAHIIFKSHKSLKAAFETAKLLQTSWWAMFSIDSHVYGRNISRAKCKSWGILEFIK